MDRLRTAADEAVARAAALEANSSAERENLLTDLDAARAAIEQLEERAAAANAALGALEAQAASDRGELLHQLAEARADAEQLAARILAEESEAAAERRQLLADLDAANAEANRLAKQLEDTSLDAQELAATADELLSIADAELEASRAERARLQAEVAGALEEQGQLLILVDVLRDQLAWPRKSWQRRGATSKNAKRKRTPLKLSWSGQRRRTVSSQESCAPSKSRSGDFAMRSHPCSCRKPSVHTLRLASLLIPGIPPEVPREPRLQNRWNQLHDQTDEAIVRAYLDPEFYRASNPDVAAQGADPVDHYREHGKAERRDPHPEFSTSAYLQLHPDLAPDENPFAHAMRAGWTPTRYNPRAFRGARSPGDTGWR